MSSVALNRIRLVLAILGLLDAGYLYLAHTGSAQLVCFDTGCARVAASEYSRLWGVSIAGLGWWFYLTIALASIFRSEKQGASARRWDRGIFLLCGFGFLFSLFLQGISIFKIGALCFWCVLSAVNVALLTALSWKLGYQLPPELVLRGEALRLFGWGLLAYLVLGSLSLGYAIIRANQPVDPHLLIRPSSHFKGPKDAPVVMVLFSDFECPVCAEAKAPLEVVYRRFQGELKFVYRHFPLKKHPHAELLAESAEAAGAQGKFWEMHNLLFENQDKLKNLKEPQLRQELLRMAQKIGLNGEQFKRDLETQRFRSVVEQDRKDGEALGIDSTPTIFINGRRYTGEGNVEAISAVISGYLRSIRH